MHRRHRFARQLVILLFALGCTLSAYPGGGVAAVDGCETDVPPAEQSDCRPDGCCEPETGDRGDTSAVPSDCCPDECDHCSLPCCGGVPAVAGIRFVDLIEPPAQWAAPVSPPRSPLTAHRHEIDHPPRF